MANRGSKIDWESILAQSETAKCKIPQQIRHKIFTVFLRYPTCHVEKIIVFFALIPQEQIKLLPSLNK